MTPNQQKRISKFLSLVLRHQPETIGITLDPQGWVDVDSLLKALHKNGRKLSRQELNEVVNSNDKQRFAFDETETRIRASQGHSVDVELGYERAEPPEILYHGTSHQVLNAIRRDGLKKMQRHSVHMHEGTEVATSVGKRHGKPVVLIVLAGKMHAAGYEFSVSPNHVWLTESVPPEYLEFPES